MDLLCTVTLPSRTGIPKDAAQNSFVVRTAPGFDPATDLLEVTGPIADFYTLEVPEQAGSVSNFLSATLNRSAGECTIKLYELGQLGMRPGSADAKNPNGKPYPVGSPIAEDSFTLDPSNAGTASLPSQVAVAMTLRGRGALEQPVEEPDDGDQDDRVNRPRQRSTGRIYLGPLATNAVAYEDVTHAPRPSVSLQNTILGAAEALQDELNSAGHIWCVWSRTAGVLLGVTRVEVDDRFDTIRKRLAGPSLRNVRTFAPVPSLALGA